MLAGFTGEHVGEPRLLICLYDAPLLHVDLKFVTPAEFRRRVEDPELLLDKNGELAAIISETAAHFPLPDFQWIEDRFWIWVHYALLKIGRGEYLEAFDFFAYLRMVVFGPLMHLRQGNLPRGVRKVELQLPSPALADLLGTVPAYNRDSLLQSLRQSISLYRQLRNELYPSGVERQEGTELAVMNYLDQISKQ